MYSAQHTSHYCDRDFYRLLLISIPGACSDKVWRSAIFIGVHFKGTLSMIKPRRYALKTVEA